MAGFGLARMFVGIVVRDAAFSHIADLENMGGRFHEVAMPAWRKEQLGS